MIEIKDLVKKYGENLVLNGINQRVESGQTIAIIGPSGSGKTTLLRCINLTETVTSGEIWVNGKRVTHKTSMPGRNISGMVFQDFNLFPHLTVLKNLTIAPTKLKSIPLKDAEKRAHQLLKKFGLADKAGAYPKQLSGGQKQRVAIARELAMNPYNLLFDEPTSALDPENVGELEQVIHRLKQDQITMLIVSHNINFALNVADRVWFIDKGRIIADAPPTKIVKLAQDNPRMRDYFKD